jgi:hypothetical protein
MNGLRSDRLCKLAGGQEVVVVSDDAGLCQHLIREELTALLLRPDLKVANGSHVVLALCHQLVSRSVRKQFSNAAVLVLPIHSFDDCADAILYTVTLAFATDYEDACRRNRQWVELLRNKPDGVLRFVGPGTDIRCQLRDRLRVNTSLDLRVNPGEWVSIADYCEVSVTAPSQADWLGAFTIDGYAEAVGVLVAEDSRVTPVGQERIRRAKVLRRELVREGPVQIVIEGGILRSAMVGGVDRAKEVADVTNPDYSLHTLELGLGSNPGVSSQVDWMVNSQLNEGVGQVHLGYGEGITGAHVDFVINGTVLG